LRPYVAVLVAGTLVPALLTLLPPAVALAVAFVAATGTARLFPAQQRERQPAKHTAADHLDS
jgi:hypothetical protein